jgi:hypothetical protein
MMLATLRSTDVVGKSVPVRTCHAIQAAVETATSDSGDLRYYLPDRPQTRDNQIVSISCVPLLLHERGEPSS